MPTTMGAYAAGLAAGSEVSSTYKGRHLTVLETELIHPYHADDLVDAGDPVIIVLADAANPHAVKGHAVGVALISATAVTDYISVDTEGIFNLTVHADDDSGGATGVINPGDPLYISDDSAASDDAAHDGTGDAVISKIKNRNIQVPFGYALGQIDNGAYGVIAVKVHWDPSVGEEQVGVTGAPLTDAVASKHFRDYYYAATGGGYITGENFDLDIPVTAARTFVARTKYFTLTIPAAGWIVTGLGAVLALKLVVTAGDEAMCQHTLLNLHYDSLQTNSTTNSAPSYIRLEDAHEDNNTSCMRNMLYFADHAALPDGGVTTGWEVIQDCNAAKTHTVSVRCAYGVGATPFWLMGHTDAPD